MVLGAGCHVLGACLVLSRGPLGEHSVLGT
jgi:hypothetical protein